MLRARPLTQSDRTTLAALLTAALAVALLAALLHAESGGGGAELVLAAQSGRALNIAALERQRAQLERFISANGLGGGNRGSVQTRATGAGGGAGGVRAIGALREYGGKKGDGIWNKLIPNFILKSLNLNRHFFF